MHLYRPNLAEKCSDRSDLFFQAGTLRGRCNAGCSYVPTVPAISRVYIRARPRAHTHTNTIYIGTVGTTEHHLKNQQLTCSDLKKQVGTVGTHAEIL